MERFSCFSFPKYLGGWYICDLDRKERLAFSCFFPRSVTQGDIFWNHRSWVLLVFYSSHLYHIALYYCQRKRGFSVFLPSGIFKFGGFSSGTSPSRFIYHRAGDRDGICGGFLNARDMQAFRTTYGRDRTLFEFSNFGISMRTSSYILMFPGVSLWHCPLIRVVT